MKTNRAGKQARGEKMEAKEMIAVNRAMRDPDSLVIQMRYVDKEGIVTERVVSPIRWIGGKSLLALCLCRETPRRFELTRCSHIRLISSSDVLMPIEITTLHTPSLSSEAAASVQLAAC